MINWIVCRKRIYKTFVPNMQQFIYRTRWDVKLIIKVTSRDILRLPSYHCILNPTEHVQAHLKSHLDANSTAFKLTDMEKICSSKACQFVTAACAGHVTNQENNMYELDKITDKMDLVYDDETAEAVQETWSHSEEDISLQVQEILSVLYGYVFNRLCMIIYNIVKFIINKYISCYFAEKIFIFFYIYVYILHCKVLHIIQINRHKVVQHLQLKNIHFHYHSA